MTTQSSPKTVKAVWLDNPVFFLLRRFVYWLDNALFNHKNSIGVNYQPTLYLLILPHHCAIAAVIAHFFMPPEELLFFWAPIALGVNVLFMLGHILSMPSVLKKIFYFLFVLFFSVLIFAVIFYIAVWALAIIMVLFVSWFFLKSWWEDLGSSPAPSPAPRVVETVTIDDGSFFGKTLTKDDSFGSSYKDSGGTEYKKVSSDFGQDYFQKK